MGTLRGQNSKAVEAKERKAAVNAQKLEDKKKAAEDSKWVDDDKHANARLQRKAEAEKKAEEKMQHKQELKELAAEEEKKIQGTMKGANKKSAGKLTQAEIAKRQLLAAAQAKAEAAMRAQEDGYSYRSGDLEANPNHVAREQVFNALIEGKEAEEATTLDGTLAMLTRTNSPEGQDLHPERRVKALYQDYLERELARLKEEKPGCKMSTYKDIIFKSWQKSPENPLRDKNRS